MENDRKKVLKTTAVVIGAGICGAFVFNSLVLKGVDCVLLERGEDVGLCASKANSGIIHAGYDAKEGSLKAKFNVEGNRMFAKIAKRLSETIVERGSLVVGDETSLPKLQKLLERGKKNGVKNLKILEQEELHVLEPNLDDKMVFGLFAKDAKTISPYNFCISLCEEAILNGGNLMLNFDTVSIKKNGKYFEVSNGRKSVVCSYVINCTAESTNDINALIGEKQYDISFTKGEYMLFDHTMHDLVSRPIFPLPTEKGKGILVCPAAHGNVFVGPTAKDVKFYDTSFSFDSIDEIRKKSSGIVKGLNFRKVSKLYAGVRVKIKDDFVIDFSEKNRGFVSVCGISSPGLSAAPAIAKFVVDKLEKEQGLETKRIALKKRKPYTDISKMSPRKLDALVRRDANYGEIICNCEKISKGEILEVLRGPIQPLTTDGVKRRLRVTMGYCQGSFCYSHLVKVMSEFYELPEKDILMRGKRGLVVGDIKEGGIYEKI